MQKSDVHVHSERDMTKDTADNYVTAFLLLLPWQISRKLKCMGKVVVKK